MGHLPEISHDELVRLLQHFGCDLRRHGAPVVCGHRPDGAPFTVHQKRNRPVRRQDLTHILRECGIKRADFLNWHAKER